MANPNPTSDQPVSAISAAELRRRLLASTPPPLVATASTPDPADDPGEDDPPAAAPGTSWNGTTNDLLARLRMPGKSGSVQAPGSRNGQAPPAPSAPPAPEPPGRTGVNRRTPSPAPGSRLFGETTNAIAGALNHLADLSHNSRHDESPQADIQRLKNENKELRTLLDEMKHLLQEASETEQRLVAKEAEFTSVVAAKDAQIEELSAHLGAIEEQIARGELAPPPPAPKTRTELEEWGDELEKESAKITQEKKRIEEERRQLREDEEALEKQMRDMEVSMARERAMIARQETELKRLSAEIQHELDILQRGDAGLREQMAKFQRRAQEVMAKPPGGGPPPGRR
jgi:peptidoglycan hydrolase CwlO-like protein